jgi:hypothetical protein
MAFLVITAVACPAGAASAVFLVTVIGIRRGDGPERIINAGSSRSGACARSVPDSGTWPGIPVCRAGREDGWPGPPGIPGRSISHESGSQYTRPHIPRAGDRE